MKKSGRLAALEFRLKDLNKKVKKLESKRFNHVGSVDVDACVEYDKACTDVHLTKKKILFLNQGKSFLGDCFGLDTSGIELI